MTAHHERIHSIAQELAAANHRLIQALVGVDDRAASLGPPDGGWSAARIGMHVAITNEWITAVLRGTAPGAEPPPSGFNESWTGVAIPEKVQTFPHLVPPPDAQRAAALERLAASGDETATVLAGMSAERAGMCVHLPFGTLSLYQLAEFIGQHSDRHLAQLQRLQIPA
jgi:hypothetical protein